MVKTRQRMRMARAITRESEKLASLAIELELEAKSLRTLKMKLDGRLKKANGILIKKLLSR